MILPKAGGTDSRLEVRAEEATKAGAVLSSYEPKENPARKILGKETMEAIISLYGS